MIVAAVTDDLVSRNLHAGNLVRDAAKLMAAAAAVAQQWRRPVARTARSSRRHWRASPTG